MLCYAQNIIDFDTIVLLRQKTYTNSMNMLWVTNVPVNYFYLILVAKKANYDFTIIQQPKVSKLIFVILKSKCTALLRMSEYIAAISSRKHAYIIFTPSNPTFI